MRLEIPCRPPTIRRIDDLSRWSTSWSRRYKLTNDWQKTDKWQLTNQWQKINPRWLRKQMTTNVMDCDELAESRGVGEGTATTAFCRDTKIVGTTIWKAWQEWRKIRPDTRQSSDGQLGRSSYAKNARNSKMWWTDGRTDGPTYLPTNTARCRVACPRLKI